MDDAADCLEQFTLFLIKQKKWNKKNSKTKKNSLNHWFLMPRIDYLSKSDLTTYYGMLFE